MTTGPETMLALPGLGVAGTALLIYPGEWLARREKEWGPLTAAAARAGLDAVVADWGSLSVDGERVTARDCIVRSPGSSEAVHGVTAAFLPDVVLTTWGVDWDNTALFEEICAVSGCVHTESPLLSWLDGKADLELCLRAYEEATGARVTRPRTLTTPEAAAATEVLGDGLVIVKPTRAGKCRGIEIVPSGDVASMAREAVAGERPEFVVQSLVDDVFLYDGRRWDIRVHAMATSLDPLVCRVYREGVAKTAAAKATPGSGALDEWLNADSHLEGVRPPENLALTTMLARLRDGAPLHDFWMRMDTLIRHVFASIALYARTWPPQPERVALFAGFDVIVERAGDGDYTLRLLELNSHPGMGWEPPVSDDLARAYSDWFGDLLALARGA